MQSKDLDPSPRILLGPGPSAVHPRVLRAMTTPLIGYLDPEWLALLDEEQALLREVFGTENRLTLAHSGTGSAGMEASLANFLEPGDRIVVGCNGYFGERLAEMAGRYGATVTRVERPYGEPIPLSALREAIEAGPLKVCAVVHAETSTGVLQPLDGLAELVHAKSALLLVDCVTSLGGVPLRIDASGIDLAYSGSQKCLGCPPGLSPFTASARAVEVLRARKRPVPNWYLDLTLLERYWGPERVYHHTPSTTLHYALREGLRVVLEEGLEARWARHRATAEYLWAGLAELGLEMLVAPEHRLPSLTTVRVPSGVDEVKLRAELRDRFNIEVAGGFGPLKGKVIRVGLMGFSCRRENVATLLQALRELLPRR